MTKPQKNNKEVYELENSKEVGSTDQADAVGRGVEITRPGKNKKEDEAPPPTETPNPIKSQEQTVNSIQSTHTSQTKYENPTNTSDQTELGSNSQNQSQSLVNNSKEGNPKKSKKNSIFKNDDPYPVYITEDKAIFVDKETGEILGPIGEGTLGIILYGGGSDQGH